MHGIDAATSISLLRNAGTGRCRVSIVEEGGSAEDRCSVNRASMRPLCGLYALTAVDGTAAGDAFCAARACAAGAIAASRSGAQRSLPTAAELEGILAR
jgi:ribokinase